MFVVLGLTCKALLFLVNELKVRREGHGRIQMHFANIRENERNVNFKFAIRMQRKMTIITTQLQVLQNSLSHRGTLNIFFSFRTVRKGGAIRGSYRKAFD